MKNLTVVILTALIMACNISEPADTLEECSEDLAVEREIAMDCENDLDAMYDLNMGEGEEVDLVAPVETQEGPFESVSNEERQIASLLAEIERMLSKHAVEIEVAENKYSGLLDEFRKMQSNYGLLVSECSEMRELCDLNANGIWQTVEGAE